MKRILLIAALFSFVFTSAQYCLFLDFKAEQPEMVASSLKGMMETEWGKNIQGTKSLFAYLPNGTNESTHSLQICFPNEAAFENFYASWNQSPDAQLFFEKMGKFSKQISESLNTPIWYNGKDWANDNVFMLYQMEVSNPGLYLKEFQSFSLKIAKKLGYEDNSFGIAFPILGKNSDFTHFAWIGSPDIKTALSNTKRMFSDPLFADFSKKVSGLRKVVNTTMSVRIMDY